VGQAAQRTVEQSTFFALEPLLSVVVPVVVPVVPVAVPAVPEVSVPVVPVVVPAVPRGARVVVPVVPPVVVPPRSDAQAQSARIPRIPVNLPILLIISPPFGSARRRPKHRR
jgi:hypothetical protein